MTQQEFERRSLPARLGLGIASMAPLVLLVAAFFAAPGGDPTAGISSLRTGTSTGPALGLAFVLVTFLLCLYFGAHLLSNPRIHQTGRLAWGASFLLMPFFALPLYNLLHLFLNADPGIPLTVSANASDTPSMQNPAVALLEPEEPPA